jgi:hypothetical protein
MNLFVIPKTKNYSPSDWWRSATWIHAIVRFETNRNKLFCATRYLSVSIAQLGIKIRKITKKSRCVQINQSCARKKEENILKLDIYCEDKIPNLINLMNLRKSKMMEINSSRYHTICLIYQINFSFMRFSFTNFFVYIIFPNDFSLSWLASNKVSKSSKPTNHCK